MARLCLILLLLPLSVGCGRGTASSEEPEPSEDRGASADSLLLDDHVLVPGAVVNTRDLQYRSEDLRHRLETGNPSDPKRPKMEATLSLIEDTRNESPQCLRFKVAAEGARIRLIPVDDLQFALEDEVSVDVGVIGGEIESITLAMALARRGSTVALVYAGPLGGLCSDEGGNLRFFDGYWLTPRPDEQRELYRKAFGMSDFVSLPTEMDRRIREFLEADYSARIRLISIAAYEGARVNVSDNRIASIDLPNGTRVVAEDFVDAEPEARVSEKAGLAFDALTPNLPYGLVFDVPNISRADIESLIHNLRLSPDSIAQFAGVPLERANDNSLAKSALNKLRKDLASDFAHDRGNYWLGFKAAAEGFNLYMQLKGLESSDERLKALNLARRTSGFNIALNAGNGNFNSISYSFGFTLLQHAHSLRSDERLRAIREIEIPELRKYLRHISGRTDLEVRMPEQFYVRKSTAHFRTKHPYSRADFKGEKPESGSRWMMYPMDYRSISPRNPREKTQFNKLFWSSDVVYWQCRPDVCETEIENLYLLNKSMLAPEYSGATRILQNFVTTGISLAEKLSRQR